MRSQPQSFRSAAARALAGIVVTVTGATTVRADPPGLAASPEMNPPGRVMAQATPQPPGADATPLTPSTPDMKAVQDLLGRATGDATTAGRTADVLKLISRADHDRLGTPGDWADVDRAADAFRAAWQARFGLSFTLADKIPIVMTEPAVHVTGLEPSGGGSSTQPSTERKTNVTVVLADPGGHAAVDVRLVNEGTGKADWHVVLPAAATAATLHDGLLRELSVITADQAKWPTDVDQAYVYVTQHVLAAVGTAGPRR